jgi:hypothetical protein
MASFLKTLFSVPSSLITGAIAYEITILASTTLHPFPCSKTSSGLISISCISEKSVTSCDIVIGK